MVAQDTQLTTLDLLNLEILGSSLGIIGLSIFIFTSFRSKNVLINSYLSGRPSNSALALNVSALLGRIVLVTAGSIAGYAATIRLIQLTKKAMRNQPMGGTLEPNIWLTIGIWTSFAGGIISLVGDYKRVQESSRVPIE